MADLYDVIISGAGPAGSVLAYELAKSGVKVLVLERYKLPRYKCCAGGITYKTSRMLPVALDGLTEDVITGVEVHSDGSSSYMGKSEKDLIYTVQRDKFDNALAEKASSAGARIMQGKAVERVMERDGLIEVAAGSGIYRAKYLAGADGANGIVARHHSFINRFDYVTGINAELALDAAGIERWQGKILIDLTRISGGYAWIFPKGKTVSAGIASIKPEARKLRELFTLFLAENGLAKTKILKLGGGRIPLCKGNPMVVAGNMALVGDAAGFADPLSGEGIYYAVLSGKLLARTIKGSLHNGSEGLAGYQQLINKDIMPEIRMGRVLQKILIHFPQIPVKLLNYDSRAWRGCCYFARGELTYASARQLIGGYRGMKILLAGALGNK